MTFLITVVLFPFYLYDRKFFNRLDICREAIVITQYFTTEDVNKFPGFHLYTKSLGNNLSFHIARFKMVSVIYFIVHDLILFKQRLKVISRIFIFFYKFTKYILIPRLYTKTQSNDGNLTINLQIPQSASLQIFLLKF